MELNERVENLIAEIDKTHRYSMSKIYELYNEIFNASEIPQSCASCLIRKVNKMKMWLSAQEQTPKEEKKKEVENLQKKLNNSNDSIV